MLSVTTGLPVPVATTLLITGRRSATTTLAFSRLRTRIRGLSSVLLSPSVLRNLAVALGAGVNVMRSLLMPLRSSSVNGAPVGSIRPKV